VLPVPPGRTDRGEPAVPGCSVSAIARRNRRSAAGWRGHRPDSPAWRGHHGPPPARRAGRRCSYRRPRVGEGSRVR